MTHANSDFVVGKMVFREKPMRKLEFVGFHLYREPVDNQTAFPCKFYCFAAGHWVFFVNFVRQEEVGSEDCSSCCSPLFLLVWCIYFLPFSCPSFYLHGVHLLLPLYTFLLFLFSSGCLPTVITQKETTSRPLNWVAQRFPHHKRYPWGWTLLPSSSPAQLLLGFRLGDRMRMGEVDRERINFREEKRKFFSFPSGAPEAKPCTIGLSILVN